MHQSKRSLTCGASRDWATFEAFCENSIITIAVSGGHELMYANSLEDTKAWALQLPGKKSKGKEHQ